MVQPHAMAAARAGRTPAAGTQPADTQHDVADHFLACSQLGRYLTVVDGSRFVITDDFRAHTFGGAAAAAVASIWSRDGLVAQAALLPLGRSALTEKSWRKYERLFELIEAQTLSSEVKRNARHVLEHGFREAEIQALEADLGDKMSPARLRYRAFLGVIKQLMEGRISAQAFLDEFRDFTKQVAGRLDFGIYSFCLDRIFGNRQIPMKVKKHLAAELLRYPPLIRRELVTNLLAYPGQDRDLVSFVRGLVMAELDPTVVVEIELLETFKRNRMSMLDVQSDIRSRVSA